MSIETARMTLRRFTVDDADDLLALDLDHGFANIPIARVYAETMAVNIGSRRVMEKAGMRLIREFHADWPVRIEGDEQGDVEYAIARAEWETSRPVRGGKAGEVHLAEHDEQLGRPS